MSARPSLCIIVYNATNVSCVCRWREHKGLGGLSAFKQRWVIMADSTTGYGVTNHLPAAIVGIKRHILTQFSASAPLFWFFTSFTGEQPLGQRLNHPFSPAKLVGRAPHSLTLAAVV